MKRTFPNILPLLLLTTLTACSPTRREMPITTSSEEARELYFEAQDIIENGWLADANELLYKAIEIDPDFVMAHTRLREYQGIEKAKELSHKASPGEQMFIRAREARSARDVPLSIKIIDSLVKMYPGDKHILHKAATFCSKLEDKQARKYLKKAIRIDPYYGPGHNLLGYLYMRTGRPRKAEKAFLKYLDLNPDDSNAIDSYAEMLLDMGRIEEAIRQYDKVLYINPAFPDPSVKIALSYIWLGEFDRAREYSNRLFEKGLVPLDKKKAVLMLANIEYIQGNLQKTFDILDENSKHLNINEEDDDYVDLLYVIYYKGWYATMAGDEELAIRIINEGLDTASEHESWDAYNFINFPINGLLSFVFGVLGMEEESLKYLIKAREIFDRLEKKSSPTLMRGFESSYDLLTGNYQAAIERFPFVYDRRYVTAPFFLARAHEMAGNIDKAIENYTIVSQSFNPFYSGIFYRESLRKIEELSE